MNGSSQIEFGGAHSKATAPGLPFEASGFNLAPTLDEIIAALQTVFDPEIPVNVYDLGLIYRIEASPTGVVEIDMTLTAPGCPVAGSMLDMVKTAVTQVGGVRDCEVRLVFDPPWDQSRMSEETLLELGLL